MTAPTRTLQQEVIHPVLEHVEWNPHGIPRIPFPSTDNALNAKIFETDAQAGMWADEPALECITRTPFFEDPDKGPVSAWSALSRFNVYFIDEDIWDDNIEYRSLQPLPWGYVFWDLNMLENAGFKNISVEDRINSDFDVKFPQATLNERSIPPS